MIIRWCPNHQYKQLLISSFKYHKVINKNKYEWVYLFYPHDFRNCDLPNDSIVMLIKGDIFECVFNLKHFDEEFYQSLATAMSRDTQYYFANINEAKNDYILSWILENVVLSIELFPSWDKYHIIYLYPQERTESKIKPINSSKLIQILSKCQLNKTKFSIWILNTYWYDYEIFNILENRHWDFIIFENCEIKSTNLILKGYSIKQKWIFENWQFQNKNESNENESNENESNKNENSFVTKIFNSENKEEFLNYFYFKKDEQLINLYENHVLIDKKRGDYYIYLQRKFKYLI